MTTPTFAPASDPRNPIPVLVSAQTAAAVLVSIDTSNRLVMVSLAGEPGAYIGMAPEQAVVLGHLVAGAGRALLQDDRP